MGGRACIHGMRIPVPVIVGQIAHGASFEEILKYIRTWIERILLTRVRPGSDIYS
jgi:hypothetical protein